MDMTIEDAQEYYAVMCVEVDELRAKCNAHRERVAALERLLQEVGDLAASSLTGPAQVESLKMIVEMLDTRHNAGAVP